MNGYPHVPCGMLMMRAVYGVLCCHRGPFARSRAARPLPHLHADACGDGTTSGQFCPEVPRARTRGEPPVPELFPYRSRYSCPHARGAAHSVAASGYARSHRNARARQEATRRAGRGDGAALLSVWQVGPRGLEPRPPQCAVALSHLSYSPVITGACVASASISAYTRMPPAHTVGYRCGRFTGL